MADESKLTPEEKEELARHAAEKIREKQAARQLARDAAFVETAKMERDRVAQAEARVRAKRDKQIAQSTSITIYALLGILVLTIAIGAFWLFGRSSQPTPTAAVKPEQVKPQAQAHQPIPAGTGAGPSNGVNQRR